MVQLDEKIMEYIQNNGWASPGVLENERSISASEGQIRERCMCLHYVGFIEPIHSHMYDLTMDGILYLRGDLDARHYPEPTPSKVFQDRYPTPAKYPPARAKKRHWI